MSKSKNAELKFSIQNLIDTKTTTTPSSSFSCEKASTDLVRPSTNRSLKRVVINAETSSISRPIPIFKPKLPHPCWSYLSQLQTKSSNGNLPFNSPLIFLSKMNQVWEQIQRTQISPSIATTTTTTENDDVSDEDVYMDMSSSSSSRRRRTIPGNNDEDDDEIDDEEVDEEEEEEEGECSTSTGDKNNTTSNSDDHDKLKTYPCTQCGKVCSETCFLFSPTFSPT